MSDFCQRHFLPQQQDCKSLKKGASRFTERTLSSKKHKEKVKINIYLNKSPRVEDETSLSVLQTRLTLSSCLAFIGLLSKCNFELLQLFILIIFI